MVAQKFVAASIHARFKTPSWPFSLLTCIILCVHVHRQVHAFLHDTKASWLVHMETKAANRQDLAADIWSEVEYQLGSQWFVLLRDHAVRCATEEHAAWAKYRTYCEVLLVDSSIRMSF